MHDVTRHSGRLVFSPEAVPAAPTAEEWHAMPPEQRLEFEVAVNEALTDAAFMTEGQGHKEAKLSAIDALSLHFRTIGRTVYLAEDLAVHYPGEVPFSPDLFAVLDVAHPARDERTAWVVVVEGKAPDFILEVL